MTAIAEFSAVGSTDFQALVEAHTGHLKFSSAQDAKDSLCRRIREIEIRAEQLASRQYAPVEGDVGGRLHACARNLIEQLEQEKREIDSHKTYEHIDAKYARIDMSFMRRRRQPRQYDCPLPHFGLFSFTDPACVLEASNQHVLLKPAVLLRWWSDLTEKLVSQARGHCARRRLEKATFGLKADFGAALIGGSFDDQVRRQIRQAEPDFEELYLVAEAPDWAYSLEVVRPKPLAIADPLVVGRNGEYFWLVALFDLTSSEEYIRREFCCKV